MRQNTAWPQPAKGHDVTTFNDEFYRDILEGIAVHAGNAFYRDILDTITRHPARRPRALASRSPARPRTR
jgi:hypothetical protein